MVVREQRYACGCIEWTQDGSNPRFCPEHGDPWSSEETFTVMDP